MEGRVKRGGVLFLFILERENNIANEEKGN